MYNIKKHITYILIALVALVVCPIPVGAVQAWDGKDTEVYEGGEGTASAPYEIANAKQLAYMAKMVNAGEPYADTYFILTADINLNNKKWTPIGTAMTEFQGHIDGKGHSISGLYIKKKSKAQGLFAYTLHAELSNITCSMVNIQAKNYVGSMVGIASHTTISGCSVSGEISGEKYVGGLVGYDADAVDETGSAEKIIYGCTNKAKVTAFQYVGGVCGYYKGCIYNCNNYGDLGGVQFVGGIAGFGAANSCVNHGTIGGMQDVGGICGWGAQPFTIASCVNLGSIFADEDTGGVCGYVSVGAVLADSSNYGSVSGIKQVGGLCGTGAFTGCFNMGTVSGSTNVGGLSGYVLNGVSDYSYNQGKVKGTKDALFVGGVIGCMEMSSNGNRLAYCYNTGKVSGDKDIGGIVGLNGGEVSNTVYLVNQAATGIGSGNKGIARPWEKADMRSVKLLNLLNADGERYRQKEGSYPTLLCAKVASSSNLTTACKVGKVTAFAGKAGKKSVTLTWKPLMRVSGYEIYQYDKSKKIYVKKKTLPARSGGSGMKYFTFTDSYTVKKLKENTTYKFKIRAYKEVAGKKYYGKYQKISVKVK